MSKLLEKYRKEALDRFLGEAKTEVTWRTAILETIFRPTFEIPGKSPMSHLHPDMKKLHFPHNVYIADWRKYRVEDHPALVNFQKRCHACGLHDPWLRNYAHQYYPNRILYRSRIAFMTQGCGIGFLLATAIFGAQKLYKHFYPITYDHTAEYIEKYGTGEIGHH